MTVSQPQHIPALFAEIEKNDAERVAIADRACAGTSHPADWARLATLVRERVELRRGAENMLRRSNGRRGAGIA